MLSGVPARLLRPRLAYQGAQQRCLNHHSCDHTEINQATSRHNTTALSTPLTLAEATGPKHSSRTRKNFAAGPVSVMIRSTNHINNTCRPRLLPARTVSV